MREIKFRAKCSSAEYGHEEYFLKWIYGSLWIKNDCEYLIYDNDINEWLEIDKKTLGQFTGLKDKNGKEIYEGDIVKFSEHYIGDYRQFEETEVIKFEGSGFNDNLNVGFHDLPEWCEVVGKIYENPELLKEKGDKE